MRLPATRYFRIASQTGVFTLWVALILATKHPMESWIAKHVPVSLLLRIDPLVMTSVMGATRMIVTITLLGAVTLGVSFLLGRVFCGWVCPLGAIFDVYGWVLRRMGIRTGGPSPSWFRMKYYIFFAIVIFALIGGSSPLMGLDPIVLITRVVATVLAPIGRVGDGLWPAPGQNPLFRGYFVDGATLLLFLGVMSATTRVSRIWCRTACPLGAYLALASRNATLRRDTDGCVHCGICARICPTGAINFKDETRYVESECIKCFNCSQECPVDANYFTYKSPLPAVSPSQEPVSLERRSVLMTGAVALASAPVLNVSSGDSESKKVLIRPPMSREEPDFLTSCIRCGECMKACPTGILKPSGLENGIRALWTPVMKPLEAVCMPGCNACSQACPTDAIMKYPVENKYAYKAGTAVFSSTNCISYAENKFCNECVKVCPTDAIKVVKGWEPEGAAQGFSSDTPAPEGMVPTRPVQVIFDRCVACGACENSCDKIVLGPVAMKTTSYGRAVPTHLGESS